MTLRGICWCSLSAFLLFQSAPTYAQAPPPPGEAGPEELTRGPVHEAFGQPVTFNPAAGVVSPKAPPETVEELPPDEQPEGDTVAWVSGYWHWDDEAKEFLWVSGIWRNIPPGRTWVPGYWNETTDGYQWVSGYWPVESATEVEYLPPPPATLETGPAGDPPSAESVWAPGCWMWRETRYLWRPGYYIGGRPDWVWAPAHYEWTPAGHVFVDGYWDYPLATRGLIFAPVRFAAYRPGFRYIPQVVIDTRYLTFALFSRPAYGHYYFGDYYADTYVRGGIYPWFAYHHTRYGYDPLFAHTDFVHSRRDPRWETNLRQVYFQRRDNEGSRPARTFRAQAEAIRRADDRTADRTAAGLYLARSLQDRGRDFPVNVVKVNETNITNIRNNVKVVNQARTERVRVEKQVVSEGPPAGKATARTAPVKVKVNASANLIPPIAKGARPAAQAPEVPTAPKADATPPAKGAAKSRLPDPEEVLRPEFRRPGKDRPDPMPKASAPGKKDDSPPVPLPRPKKDIDDDPPAKKTPPKVAPKKDRDDDPPVPKPAPKKDTDDDPPPRLKVTPMPPAKADPPKTEPPPPKVDPAPRPKADPPKADPPPRPKANPPKKEDKDKD